MVVHCRQLGPVSQFMINAYCDGLQETFAKLVYYGILKPEDAQCFSVESSLESGWFLLAVGAVLLALLNTFVVKAVIQNFRDKDEIEQRASDLEDWKSDYTSGTFGEEGEQEIDNRGNNPVPVLFTDTFRWALKRENNGISSSRAFVPAVVANQRGMTLPEANIISIDDVVANDQYSHLLKGDDIAKAVGTPRIRSEGPEAVATNVSNEFSFRSRNSARSASPEAITADIDSSIASLRARSSSTKSSPVAEVEPRKLFYPSRGRFDKSPEENAANASNEFSFRSRSSARESPEAVATDFESSESSLRGRTTVRSPMSPVVADVEPKKGFSFPLRRSVRQSSEETRPAVAPGESSIMAELKSVLRPKHYPDDGKPSAKSSAKGVDETSLPPSTESISLRQARMQQEVMEDEYYTEEELVDEDQMNDMAYSDVGYSDTQSEYFEEIVDGDEYTEQSLLTDIREDSDDEQIFV